ncbi:MAG: GNAT family N-acetyltransferase [Oscillospiraceae bacterium]|jgi:GNAT superfamily N-acetyltransferase
MFTIREARAEDLPALLELYLHLHETTVPDPASPAMQEMWRRIADDPWHHILLGCLNGVPVSSCVLAVIPNLTRGPRPYALVENVVTAAEYRGNGYATKLMEAAAELARQTDCYKIMLFTGSKNPATLDFYRRVGYNSVDKTAFIRWL